MKTTYIKQLFIALFLLIASAGTASAAKWQLSNGQGTVAPYLFVPGAQDTLRLSITDNDTPFSALQVDFYLPAGALLTGDPYAGAATNGHQLTWKQSADDKQWIRILLHSATNATMQASKDELICIPIVWASDTKSANCHTANSVLATPGSEAIATTELQASLTAKVEKKPITVNVSNTEQVHQEGKTAALTVTTQPAGLTVAVSYYADAKFQTTATPNQIGTYYAKLTFAGDETYLPYEGSAVLVLTNKKEVTIAENPTATSIKQGEYLSASLLTGGEVKEGEHTVGGRFVWLDQSIQANTPGKQTFTAKFYPDNASYYATKDTSVTVEVIPTFKVTALAATGGSVMIPEGRTDNTYVVGQKLTLTAVADPNWKFTGWSDDANEKATRTITVGADKGYIANFEKIMHTVAISTPTNGTLSVMAGDVPVMHNTSWQQGTVLQVVANPATNYALQQITVNGTALTGDKIVLSGATNIGATFALKNDAQKTVTIKSTNGSLLLYDQQGNSIASGATVLKGTVLKVVTLANTGYELESVSINNNSPVADTYTVGDANIEAEATFEKKSFTVKKSAKTAANTSISAKFTTSPASLDNVQYGDIISITEVSADNASFSYLLVNGKRMALKQPITVTSNIDIVAVCTQKVDIKKEYILWPHQEFYYNGMSRNFLPFVSQTYAGFDFEVQYSKDQSNYVEKAVDAGKYTVLLTRKEDNLYKAFKETYEKGLVIKKSKVAVTKAPTSAGDNPETRPTEVTITSETTNGVTKYTLTPRDANNYEGTTYYWADPNAEKATLNLGNTLRSGSDIEEGWVRVTNGGEAFDANAGSVEIPVGFTVTLEAVPAEGFKFLKWSDGETKNPREYPVTGDKTITPVFEGKKDLSNNIALTAASSTYNGETPNLVVESSVSGFLLSVFTDKECTYPTELKNAGSYYVRIYRPADTDYQACEAVVSYTIKKAEITEKTLPSASAILAKQTLSESILEGGSAGIVPGTYAWTNPDKEMKTAGKQTVSVTFTPTDPNYESFTADIQVEVKGVQASTEPSTPDQPETPEETPAPVVEERTADTAVITWEKIAEAASYKLFLYADPTKAELLATYEFDANGQLKAGAISFTLTDLTEGKAYYVETVAYKADGSVITTKSVEIPATPTATEEVDALANIYTSHSMIHIVLSQPMGVRILNMTGSSIYQETAAEGRLDIPIASAGVYAVILHEHNRLKEVRKVIVR